MSYFLGRYLYRKWKNRQSARGPEEIQEHTDPGREDLPEHSTPSAPRHEKIDEPRERKQHKQVKLCEHQLAIANSANGVKGDALNEKSPISQQRQIPDDKRGPKHCPQCIEEKRQARVYRWKIILSLLIPNMMASMDLTITAAALPIIASHFSTLPT